VPERPLRRLSIVLSLIVAAGFILFALEDIDRGSAHARSRIVGYSAANPTPADERDREQRNSSGREMIDDANDVLLMPFAGVSANADSRWVQRGAPALLALLSYGFVLSYIARSARAHG
jgi:hypothetical protein